jgi:hypothetical protein
VEREVFCGLIVNVGTYYYIMLFDDYSVSDRFEYWMAKVSASGGLFEGVFLFLVREYDLGKGYYYYWN